MTQDFGITDAMYGLGAVLCFVGYVAFEVPSHLLLRRFGARRTFTRILLLWGAVAVAMVTVSSANEFCALRFLLGVFEAGFFPDVLVYLTLWFPAKRRARIISIFYAGVAIAGMVGGILSDMDHARDGRHPGPARVAMDVRLERAPALLLGIIAWYWLDDGPLHAQWLTSAEKQRLTTELGIERHNTVARDGYSLIEALRNPHTHLFAFVLFALTSALLLLLF